MEKLHPPKQFLLSVKVMNKWRKFFSDMYQQMSVATSTAVPPLVLVPAPKMWIWNDDFKLSTFDRDILLSPVA